MLWATEEHQQFATRVEQVYVSKLDICDENDAVWSYREMSRLPHVSVTVSGSAHAQQRVVPVVEDLNAAVHHVGDEHVPVAA